MNKIVSVELSQIVKKNGRSTIMRNVRVGLAFMDAIVIGIAAVAAAASVPLSVTSM